MICFQFWKRRVQRHSTRAASLQALASTLDHHRVKLSLAESCRHFFWVFLPVRADGSADFLASADILLIDAEEIRVWRLHQNIGFVRGCSAARHVLRAAQSFSERNYHARMSQRT